MAHNIGIDFGSTYSLFSHYEERHDKVEGFLTQGGSIYVPSVACDGDYGLITGKDAREEVIRYPELTTYRAFKMLLHETKPEKYREHGYTDITPEEVSRQFLDSYLIICAGLAKPQQFDSAVICVPAHWTQSCDRMGGRSILLNICKNIKKDDKPLLKNIRVVSEPIAATAYYAYNYWKLHEKRPFEGKVIIVDYGGGTLDVTLTTVTAKAGARDSSLMEIDVNYQTGCGQNHPGQIGDAGLAYMERVTAEALKEAGIRNTEIDGHFQSVKDKLESELIERTLEIRDRIEQNYMFGLEEMADDTEVFTKIRYKRKTDVVITYGLLYRVFDSIIRPVLNQYLGEIKEALAEIGCSFNSANSDVQLAIVGGFGQYPLVQHAVWDFFGATDTAMDITQSAPGDNQNAISYGAALIAAGKITVPVRSRYSIGLRIFKNDNQKSFRNAIHYGELIPDSKIVYPLGHKKDGKVEKDFWDPIIFDGKANGREPWVFAVNTKNEPNRAIEMVPQPQILEDINSRVVKATGLLQAKIAMSGVREPINSYYFGFSKDESEIYHLHIFAAHPLTAERIKDHEIHLELGNFAHLFGSMVSFTPKPDNSNVLTYIK